MDYRKFLGTSETLVLPYLGGLQVHAMDRRLRLKTAVAAGWWSFEVRGRWATPLRTAEPPDLSRLPTVRGHLVDTWLFVSGRDVERVYLMPEEEPAPLTPAVGRRWPSGEVLFDRYEFEDAPELDAREGLLADAVALRSAKGVVPSLKAAYGFAVAKRLAAVRGLTVSPLELLGVLHEIATGAASPGPLLDLLEARQYSVNPSHRRPEPRRQASDRTSPEERTSEALAASGATFVSGRALDASRYEVTFRLRGQSFIAVVDPSTLHVYDSGICLSGHDEDLGLHALPAVILEAIETDQLHITRW